MTQQSRAMMVRSRRGGVGNMIMMRAVKCSMMIIESIYIRNEKYCKNK